MICNHNRKLIDNQRTNKLLCNCRNEEHYPMGGKCNSEKVVNLATIFSMENSKEARVYNGILDGNWKHRFYNHKYSFFNPLLRSRTALSRWFLSLREKSLTPQFKWRFIKKSTPLNFNIRYNLGLEDKISTVSYIFTNY